MGHLQAEDRMAGILVTEFDQSPDFRVKSIETKFSDHKYFIVMRRQGLASELSDGVKRTSSAR